MPKETVLGFDFGMKRIGVAVGNKIIGTATPLTTLNAVDGVPDWDEITKLIKNWRPSALLVGIPLNIDETEQTITYAARRFGKKLNNRTGLSIIEVDERLTTVEARAQLFDDGGYHNLKRSEVDSVAAKLIVEQWMNTHNV